MIFDVQSILKTDDACVHVEGRLDPPADFADREILFNDDAHFSGELENIGGLLELTVCAKGSFSVPCARCTKMTNQNFCVSMHEALAEDKKDVADRDAVIPFTGTCVDLGAVIWPNILLELATKYVCDPDCKGLCPHCGADLNEGTCNCAIDDIDPRLAGLKDLLK